MDLKCFEELIAVVPQTYGEAIQKYPWLPGEPHEWDNRTTIENAIWLIRYLTYPHHSGRTISKKTKIVVLCGSSKFVDVMAVCAWFIERDEQKIATGLHLLPMWYPDCPDDHLAEHEGVAAEMDELHLRKIDIADEVFIINYGDYIGESTSREIDYAKECGKKIRWYNFDQIGDKVQALINFMNKKGI